MNFTQSLNLRGSISSVLCSVLALAVLTGCHPTAPAAQSSSSSAAQPAPGTKVFDLRGKITAVDTNSGLITIDHEAIPGFMDAMTMSYKLKDKNVATELHPGDHITAKLLVDKDDNVLLDQVVVTAQAKPDYKPAAEYHVPQPGESVPNFAFVNQNGHTRHISDYKGHVLLVTFIYTRCALSDYCIKMSRNFAAIDQALSANPALYAKTHLLSISFDPVYDKPAVLKSYGEAFTGRGDKETFAHWEFAATPEKELPQVEQYFDLGVTSAEDHTISHSLSTMVVGADGKVITWYPSNDWTPQDVENTVRKALSL